MLAGGVRCVSDEQVRHRQPRKDADTQTAWTKAHSTPILEFIEKMLYMPAKPARGGKWRPQFYPRKFVGMLHSSSEAVVITEQGSAIKTRAAHVRRLPESERWDGDRILGMRAVPWSPHGSDNAFDIQVGMQRPFEMVPRLGGVLMENKVARTYLRRADFEQQGLSEGCPRCQHLRTGQRPQQAYSEARRRRIEGWWRTPEPVGIRQQKEDHNEEGTT